MSFHLLDVCRPKLETKIILANRYSPEQLFAVVAAVNLVMVVSISNKGNSLLHYGSLDHEKSRPKHALAMARVI